MSCLRVTRFTWYFAKFNSVGAQQRKRDLLNSCTCSRDVCNKILHVSSWVYIFNFSRLNMHDLYHLEITILKSIFLKLALKLICWTVEQARLIKLRAVCLYLGSITSRCCIKLHTLIINRDDMRQIKIMTFLDIAW